MIPEEAIRGHTQNPHGNAISIHLTRRNQMKNVQPLHVLSNEELVSVKMNSSFSPHKVQGKTCYKI